MLPDLSLAGFNHSVASIERMSMAKLGRPRDEATKLKLSSNTQAHAIIEKKKLAQAGETKVFTSIRKAAEFIGIHSSYLAKCLNENNLYTGNGGYTIVNN